MAGRHVIIEAGLSACSSGAADWCQGCGRCRYRSDMRWLVDLYRCRACLGEDVGEIALEDQERDVEPSLLIPIIASVPRDWGASELVRG